MGKLYDTLKPLIDDIIRERDEARAEVARLRNYTDAAHAAEAEAERLREEVAKLNRELELEDVSFDLRHAADMRGIALWQKAHPDKPLTLPSHDDLVCYLIGEVERLREERDSKAAIAKAALNEMAWLREEVGLLMELEDQDRKMQRDQWVDCDEYAAILSTLDALRQRKEGEPR